MVRESDAGLAWYDTEPTPFFISRWWPRLPAAHVLIEEDHPFLSGSTGLGER